MPYLPTAAYSIYIRVELQNVPNTLGRFATAVGEAGANIVSMGGFDVPVSYTHLTLPTKA